MNVHQKTIDVAAAQQSLDLAVIGNGRTAALVNPMARIVWWCFPRFDGDPVFCRLLSGDEEKGFTDVVLDGFVSAQSEYVRNTAIVTTMLTDKDGGNGAHHRFRAALPEFRAHLPPAAADAHHRADRGPAAHHDPLPPDRRATAARRCSAPSAATTSAIPAATSRSASPPTRRSPISTARRRSC